MNTQLLVTKLQKFYPQAKFIEATDWQIEDDSIELNEDETISLHQDGTYGYTLWIESEESFLCRDFNTQREMFKYFQTLTKK